MPVAGIWRGTSDTAARAGSLRQLGSRQHSVARAYGACSLCILHCALCIPGARTSRTRTSGSF